MKKSINFTKGINLINILLLSLLFASLLTIGAAYLFGFRAYLVISGSSEPYIKTGSLVIDYKSPEDQLHVGDFITFSTSGSANTTHWITSISVVGNVRYYTTNQVDGEGFDITVTYKQIKGKVIFSLPKVGLTIIYVRNNFFQIIVYIMIGYIGREFLKVVPDYIKLF